MSVMQCPHGEGGDELGHVFEGGEKKHHAEEEQQVVVTRQHVACAQRDVAQVAAIEHVLAVSLGGAVGCGQQGQGQ